MRRSGAVLLVLSTLLTGCQGGCAEWNEAFERMVNQPKDKTFGASDFYSDGRSMRLPPDGAISREQPLGDSRLNEGLNADGSYVTNYPIALTPELLQRGHDRFDITCAVCHSILGDSDTPVADKMQLRKPPSLHEARIVAFPPGHIYNVIHQGYGLMPAYNAQLDVYDRWAVVAYVKALQLSQGVPIVTLPPSLQEEARRALR